MQPTERGFVQEVAVLFLLGVAGGMVTTVSGLGGGLIVLLVLAVWLGDPVAALALATPALLVGNAHRVWLYRAELPRRDAAVFAGASLVGALLGGLVAVALPPIAIRVAMVSVTGLAVAQHVWGALPPLPRSALAPGGFVVGVVSTAGGQGLLAGPMLQATGLRGGPYLGVLSASGVAGHVGRMVALSATGAFGPETVVAALPLMAGIPLGNAVGRVVRGWFAEPALDRLEIGTTATLVALSLAGLVR